MSAKPSVLVLGGCGFVGRNLVSFLVDNQLVGCLRVVDKVPPQVAWLNRTHEKSFASPLVEFRSANLINSESCARAFERDGSHNSWDFVINCAGETKCGQTDPVYEEGILKLSQNCSNQALKHKVKHYVELSSGNMASSEKVAHKETMGLEPWTPIAIWKKQVEHHLSTLQGLNWTIIRLPIVYGLADRTGLMPRILAASIYKQLNETMKLLWNGDLKLNTVHVEDVCKALWFVCQKPETIKQTYNLVDEANSSQDSLSQLLTELYEIKVSYYGPIMSSVVDLAGVADDANDKHLVPWAEACNKDNVQNTPLSPHMFVEWLVNKHLHLDGTKLKELGFQYSVPKPTIAKLKEMIEDYVEMKVLPSSLAP